MTPGPLLIQALVYLAAGVIAVPVAKRVGLGAVLGYLVAGVLIGPVVLGLVGDAQNVVDFAEYGVVILLFLIGLEVRPALLWERRGSILGLGAMQLCVTTAAIAAVAAAVGLPWRAAIATGAMLSMSSTAIVLTMLDEKGLRRGPVGAASFGVLLFQDLAVIPLFALLPLLARGGRHAHPPPGRIGGMLASDPAWLRAIAILAAVALVVGAGRYLTRPAFRFIASARLREIFTATALLLVLAVAALMQLVGLSPALGAFLAGTMLAESEFRRELESDIEPFRGLLLGLFFMTVGAGLDLRLIAAHPALLVASVLGLMLLKTGVMAAIGRLGGLPARDAGTVAVSLSQGGEFAFVLIGMVGQTGVIGHALGQILSATVALSMMATPLAAAGWERLADGIRPARGADPDPEAPSFARDAEAIVAGYGRVGQIVGRLLESAGHRVSVMDVSMSTIDSVRAFGRTVSYGDATRIDLLEAAGAGKARLLVVAIDDRERAADLVSLARERYPHLRIVARAWDRRDAYVLLARGADHVERETFEGSVALGRAALRALGMRSHRATRAAGLFRLYDAKLFARLRPRFGSDGFILASRESAAMFQRLLEADLESIGADGALAEWDSPAPVHEEAAGRGG